MLFTAGFPCFGQSGWEHAELQYATVNKDISLNCIYKIASGYSFSTTARGFCWPRVQYNRQANQVREARAATTTPSDLAERRANYLKNRGYSTKPTGFKVGAICRDGWQSSSVGPGTCSHHGGVKYYLFAD